MPDTLHIPSGRGPSPRLRLSLSEASQALRASQKSSAGAPAYSRFVNRKIGRHLAAGAYVAGLTPNQVTAVSAVFTLSAIVLIASVEPSTPVAAVVALLLLIGYAFDAADGQLARLRGGGSLAGEWLDHVVDAGKASALHLAVAVCWFRFYDFPATLLLLPLLFAFVAPVFFFAMILTDQLRRLHRGTSEMILTRQGTTSALYSLAVAPADYGLLCLLFFLLAWPFGFAILYGAVCVANLVILGICLVRWFREVSSFGRGQGHG